MATYLRADWGSAFPVGGKPILGPVSEVYIHHWNSNIRPEATVASAKRRVLAGQFYHAITNGWGDIGYSWMVDDLGNAYEGRGWGKTGAHTYMFNSKGYGICWLGDSNVQVPSNAALFGIVDLIKTGIGVGAIRPNPTILAHRDRVPDTSCCGTPMVNLLGVIREAITGTPIMPLPPFLQAPPLLVDEEDDLMRLFLQGQTVWLVRDGRKKKLDQAFAEVGVGGNWPTWHAALKRLHKSGILATDPDAIPQLDWDEMALIPNEA